MKCLQIVLVLTGVVAAAQGAHASIINTLLPLNAYIVHRGLEWAWASPVAADGSFAGGSGHGAVDLSFQGAFGWRLPTADELFWSPSAKDFVFEGANVPVHDVDPISGAYFSFGGPGADAACAAPWFNNEFVECDWENAPGSDVLEPEGPGEVPWWGQPGARTYSESLVVRSHTVPEPGSFGLLGVGLAGLGLTTRRRARIRTQFP
jgi:hypothetical protein